MNSRRRYQATSILACLLFSCSLPSMAATVAYWNFEEGTANTTASGSNSVLDTSGNGLHGTPSNGPIYRSSPVAPGSSLSMEFDGSNDRVTVSDNSLFQLTQSLTIEAHIRVDAYPTGNAPDFWHMILFRGDDRGGLDPYWLSIDPSGNIGFYINNALNQTASVSTPIALNQFTHVIASLDDTTSIMRLFLDGSLAATTTTSIRPLGALTGSNPGIGIGSSQLSTGGNFFYFDGIIDDLRLSDTAVVPIPAAAWLFLSGLLGLIGIARRKKAA